MLQVGISEIEITPREYGHLGRLIAEPTQVTGVVGPLYARILKSRSFVWAIPRLSVLAASSSVKLSTPFRKSRRFPTPSSLL